MRTTGDVRSSWSIRCVHVARGRWPHHKSYSGQVRQVTRKTDGKQTKVALCESKRPILFACSPPAVPRESRPSDQMLMVLAASKRSRMDFGDNVSRRHWISEVANAIIPITPRALMLVGATMLASITCESIIVQDENRTNPAWCGLRTKSRLVTNLFELCRD